MAALIESMIGSGKLRLTERHDDPLVPGRVHERYQQSYEGIPVLGADITQQRRNGQVISAFGIVYDGLAMDVTPTNSVSQITTLLRGQGVGMATTSAPMMILPTNAGGIELVYAMHTSDGAMAYVSARDASTVMQITQKQTQSAVGLGTGTLGDAKKMSATSLGGTFVSQDALRPPSLQTYDLQGNYRRLVDILLGRAVIGTADLASKSDNVWTDGAIVDAHVNTGWVYDYYYKRFQRRDLDNNDLQMRSMLHSVRLQDYRALSGEYGDLYLNAFYDSGCRCMVYGEGLPAGVSAAFPAGVRNFATALDIVGHELTHAVTDATSRLNYANESGALNEAFSDIMGTSIEFFHQPAGSGPLKADYQLGEDLAAVGGEALMRSLQSPPSYGQPDHYFDRAYIGANTSDFDSGGVHYNSGIANNAFYLAIEGGRHPTSGQRVTGVGAANREQIEKIYYRAFTAMLSSNSTFYLARVATIQSARDLYGAGSAPERAIIESWNAVGVLNPASALTTNFSPRSVPANTVACSGSTARPSFTFRVSVSEFQRVGFTVSDFTILSYDSQMRKIATDNFTDATFRGWFNQCSTGSTRIGPGATACATICGDLGGRSSGHAIFLFYGYDDNGTPGLFNSPVLSMGLPARDAVETPVTTAPSFTKAGAQ
jgi:thermolysin